MTTESEIVLITQKPNIQFCGRRLGDVIGTYGGEPLLRRIEYIRSTSVDRACGIEAQAIDPGLGARSLNHTLAFMLFPMLANLAHAGIVEPSADLASATDGLQKKAVGHERYWRCWV